MEASLFFSHKIFRFFLFFSLLLIAGCTNTSHRKVHPSFYYWKTKFSPTDSEKETLSRLSITHLYVKFFDVEWDKAGKKPIPVALADFRDPLQNALSITPVVFITNETIREASPLQIDELAFHLAKLLTSIATNSKLQLSNEFQIDCDWTPTTKEKYFQLLTALRRQEFLKKKLLSVTIRLHQLKFVGENGVPPADKGLLMCYNMGNLRHAETKNSIIDVGELKKYISNLRQYPLPLDVALPLFNWYIWFEGTKYKGLISDLKDSNKQNRIRFEKDTIISGYRFSKHDWLRYEQSDYAEVLAAAKMISKKLPPKELHVILYHLDEENLSNYKHHELETIYNCFR